MNAFKESVPRKLCAVITVCMIHHIKTHKRAEGKQKCHFFFSSFELGLVFCQVVEMINNECYNQIEISSYASEQCADGMPDLCYAQIFHRQ